MLKGTNKRGRRDGGFGTSTIFTSAVRSLFLPLLDTSQNADDAEAAQPQPSKSSKPEGCPPRPSPTLQEEPLPTQKVESVDRKQQVVVLQHVPAPGYVADPGEPSTAAASGSGGLHPGLVPPAPGFRPVSPSFKRGRFFVTEVETVSDEERDVDVLVSNVSQGSDNAGRLVSNVSQRSDNGGHLGLAHVEQHLPEDNADKAYGTRENGVGAPPMCQGIEIVVSPSEAPVATSSTDDEVVSFIPSSPTVRRGRFNVTPMQVSRRNSCSSEYALDEAATGEAQEDNCPHEALLKPLKGILRRVSESTDECTTPHEETQTGPDCWPDTGRDQLPLAPARLPFTPHDLEELLTVAPLKKSVRFSEATLERLSAARAARRARARERAAGVNGDAAQQATKDVTEEPNQCIKSPAALTRDHVGLVLYILAGALHGLIFAYTVSVVTSVERRFQLTGQKTGSMLAGVDVGHVLVALAVCYRVKRIGCPRLVGAGFTLVAAACVTAVVPHLLYGAGYTKGVNEAGSPFGTASLNATDDTQHVAVNAAKEVTCVSPVVEGACGDAADEGKIQFAVSALLMASHLSMGGAFTVFLTVAADHLDNTINKNTSPVCYGAGLMLRVSGPVMGYVVGAQFVPWPHNVVGMLPRGLERWWPGFLILGLGLTTLATYLLLAPTGLTTLARQIAWRKHRTNDLHPSRRYTLKGTLSRWRRVLGVRSWLVHLAATATFTLAVASYWSFRPAYMQQQLRKTNADANFYTGLASLVSVAVGVGMGGVVMQCWQPRPRAVVAFNVAVTLFGVAVYVGLVFVGCPKLKVEGPIGSSRPPCSSDCGCSSKFSPMCGEDQMTLFYSPCYAGCTTANTSVTPVVYHDCKCVNMSSPAVAALTSLSPTTNTRLGGLVLRGGGSGTQGYCPMECTADFFKYMALLVLTQALHGATRLRCSVLLLRWVCRGGEKVAVSMLASVCLLAILGAPSIVHAFLDSACLVWDSSCGVTGNCWLYDSDKFRTILHLVPAVLVGVTWLGDVAVCWDVWHRSLDQEDEDEEEAAEEKEHEHSASTERLRSLERGEARALRAGKEMTSGVDPADT